MVKSHKRHKTTKNQEPLGTRTFVDDKDDEERRLESMLFGVPYEPQGNPLTVISDVQDESTASDLKELENMLDSDVCLPPSITRPIRAQTCMVSSCFSLMITPDLHHSTHPECWTVMPV